MDFFNTVFDARMENLFNKDIITQVAIVDMIQSEKNGISTAGISNLLSIDKRTVVKHINNINDYLTESNMAVNGISTVRNQHFFNGDSFDAQKMILHLLSKSSVVRLSLSIVNQDIVEIETFVSENYISSTYFFKMINKLNAYFVSYGIHLRSKQGMLTIDGNEGEIRYIITGFLWRVYRGTTWPFTNVSKSSVRVIIDTLINYLGVSINDGKRAKLMYMLAVNISRSNGMKAIADGEIPEYSMAIINDTFPDIYIHFEQALRNVIRPGGNDITFMFMWLLSLSDFYLFDNSIFAMYDSIRSANAQVFGGINLFVNAVQEQSSNNELIRNTLFLSTVISSRISVDLFPHLTFIVSSVNINEYKRRFAPALIPTISTLLEQDSSLTPLQRSTLAFRYSNSLALVLPINTFEPLISIYLETDFPIYIEVQIWHELEELLGRSFNIRQQKKLVTSSCDLIINVNLAVNDTGSATAQRIYTHVHMTDSDHQQIYNKCREILKAKRALHE
ncbi:helix-turn-helix domain-containing protein [Weissella muntiaci]|nr:helix-turn-helix domain-containing protein [Weissella muntiaci]